MPTNVPVNASPSVAVNRGLPRYVVNRLSSFDHQVAEGADKMDTFYQGPATVGKMSILSSPQISPQIINGNFSTLNNVCNDSNNTEKAVIGVAMTADELNHKKDPLTLGVIVIQSLDINVPELRRQLGNDLPALPPKFSFFTKEGWPIMQSQEKYFTASHLTQSDRLITIRRVFDQPRIGVMLANGGSLESLGFIFIELHSCLTVVRKAIDKQLRDSSKPRFDYRFRDRNRWPIQTPQESVLVLLDLLTDNNVCIEYVSDSNKDVRFNEIHNQLIPKCPPTPKQTSDVVDGNVDPSKPPRRVQSIKFPWPPTNRTKAPDTRNGLIAKPILISYVRQEASQHALNLKNELCSSGFSVYLDVHEIKTGSDWQDALNYAVSHCSVFVPLITPMYGKTQWTNREVKLADALHKVIIPINFLEYWPPECLAIQFASTQYIPWKSIDPPEHSGIGVVRNDPHLWEDKYIKQVSKEIAERARSAVRQSTMLYSVKRSKSQKATKFALDTAIAPLSGSDEPEIQLLKKPESKPLVVISAHPKQTLLAYQVKETLEKEGYEVWCSTELLDLHMNDGEFDQFPSNPNTPRELPTIPEGGESVFDDLMENIQYTVISSNEMKRSLKDYDGLAKRPLQRISSQASEISQVSSLSQDKMEKLRQFQHKADNAALVIILASEAYGKSKTCQQQIYYCEHRKKVVLVKVDNSPMPTWFTMLMGNDMIPGTNHIKLMNALKGRVRRAVDPSSSETPKDATSEAKIQYLVSFLKQKLPPIEKCVYIVGSSKIQNEKTEEICKSIGQELAKMEGNLTIVTGGFCGVPELVARSFYEARKNNSSEINGDKCNASVVHILPIKDTSTDISAKTTQTIDGSFQPLPFGITLFAGDSIKERESAVARLLDTCIVIEGGPGAAHEVEEFIWNDHFVIPIKSTGGAAEGHFGVPMKIFEVPPGVSSDDWAVLSEKQASINAIATAVTNIVQSLKQSIVSHSQRGQNTMESEILGDMAPKKTKAKRSRKSKRVKELKLKEPENSDKIGELKGITYTQIRNSMERMEEINDLVCIQTCPTPNDTRPAQGKWRKFCHMIKFTKSC